MPSAAMGAPVLGKQALAELKPCGFDKSTPLWYYALKEAQASIWDRRPDGSSPIGLIQTDPGSHLFAPPDWQPTLQKPGPGFALRTSWPTRASIPPVAGSKTSHVA
jgi:hypothetical protein